MKKNKNEKNDSNLNQDNSNHGSQKTNPKERFLYPDYPYFALDDHKYAVKEDSELSSPLTGNSPSHDEEGIQNENTQMVENTSNTLNPFLMDIEHCDSEPADSIKKDKQTEEPEKNNRHGSFKGDNIRDNDEHQNDTGSP